MRNTKVTSKQSNIGNEKLARPDHIYVYDFAATPADLAPEDVATAQYAAPNAPQSAKEIEDRSQARRTGREKPRPKIQAMGLPAAEATADATTPGTATS